MVLAVSWPLACGGGWRRRVRRSADLRPRRRQTGQARTLIVRPDGTGSVQLEHGIDEPERVTLRLTARGARPARAARPEPSTSARSRRTSPSRSRTPTATRCSLGERGGQLAGRRTSPPELEPLWGELEALAREVRASARVALVELAQHRLQLTHAPRDLIARCRRPRTPCGRGSGSRTAKKSQQLPPFGLRTSARSARRIAAARLRPSRLESRNVVRAILPRHVAVDLHRLFDAGDTPGLRVLDRTAQHRRGGADGSDGEPHQG